ncbi:hypothetical protein [Streptomyces parvulus]|uniref:hypothetical protein n=1 Tax=Streptomyces parvulus TaxID=146923 RepID=UPI00371342C5
MAVRFSGGGDSNRSASPVELLVVAELVLLSFAAGLSRSALRGSLALRTLLATSVAAATALGYLFTVVVLVNAQASSADEARMPLWHGAVAVALAAASVIGARRAAARWNQVGTAGPGPRGSVGLRPKERAVWARTVGPRWLVAVGVLGGIAAVAAGVLGWPSGFWLSPVGLLVAVMSSTRVFADAKGLTVRLPVLPAPRIHIPLQRIEKAWSAEVRPLSDLGGWGYRVAARRRGLALRSGPALWLELDDGKQFVVAVDDAATAAGLLSDLLARGSRDH